MHLTLLPPTVERLDQWIAQQPDEHITRQEAIRRLLDEALARPAKRIKQRRGS
jgi:hypothetical protein